MLLLCFSCCGLKLTESGKKKKKAFWYLPNTELWVSADKALLMFVCLFVCLKSMAGCVSRALEKRGFSYVVLPLLTLQQQNTKQRGSGAAERLLDLGTCRTHSSCFNYEMEYVQELWVIVCNTEKNAHSLVRPKPNYLYFMQVVSIR